MGKILKAVKNFYVVLSVCVLTVLVVCSGFFIKYTKEQSLKKMALYSPSEYVETEIVKEAASVKNIEKNPPKEVSAQKNEKKEEKEVMSLLKKSEFKILLPAGNEIINKFSGEELVYSETFRDYRVHNGIDISCERSKPVFAVYDGVIEDVYADSLEGIVISINHNNGFKSVYKNLSTDKMVKKGEKVVKGQVISGVGETAIFEALEESHIHFELMKNGKYVNPEEYLED